ncbi:MAG: sugar phosphate isomerase/epimerase [Bryobacteraceae bacterium]|jgi:sugar phosphate isomerase/epimerase
MPPTRREFSSLALAGLGLGLALARAARAHAARYKGVRLGIGTYSFRGLKLDEIIRIVAAAKVGGIELESPFVEPALPPAQRDALHQWRLTVKLDELKAIRKKLDQAGISVYAYSLPINASFTDEEIDRVMLMTKALGSPVLNTSTTLPVARRIAPFAEKHKLLVGLHPNGNASDPNSIGSGESYLKAFELSPRIYANPDLYLFRNWGADPIAFLRQIHSRITTLHFHDRKLNVTPQVWVPFGEGDTPGRELLLLARNEKYQFTFSIERIYTVPGFDQLTEILNSLHYCEKVLDS